MRKRHKSYSKLHIVSKRNLEKESLWPLASILIGCLLCKYAAGTVVSLLLREPPVWVKGFRHIQSFLLAFVLIQAPFPFDFTFRWLCTNRIAEFVLHVLVALGKLRKIVFSVVHPAIANNNRITCILVAFLALEGSSIQRKIEAQRMAGQFGSWLSKGLAHNKLTETLSTILASFMPGLLSILLVGVGHNRWFCLERSLVSMFENAAWIPTELKYPALIDVLVVLDTMLVSFLRYGVLPAAFLVLQYRYLRQLAWLPSVFGLKTDRQEMSNSPQIISKAAKDKSM